MFSPDGNNMYELAGQIHLSKTMTMMFKNLNRY